MHFDPFEAPSARPHTCPNLVCPDRDDELRARQEAALAECTFRPATNQSSGTTPGPRGRSVSTGRLPLHERVGEVLRQKSEKLANARISMVCLLASNTV